MRFAAVFIVIGAILAGAFLWLRMETPPQDPDTSATRTIILEGISLHVLVAESEAERALGLGERDSLEPYGGMLFILDTRFREAVWMKGMRFPLDILWLSSEGVVVMLEKNIAPTDTRIFTSDSPARYVLEVPAGFADEYDITVGSRASLE